MRAGGGKQKGAQFEREICVKLSLWLTDGAQEDVLWRSSMSGGRSTVAHAKGKRMAAQAGDISAIDPRGHALIDKFVVECKAYADLNFIGLLRNTGHLVKFWTEVKTQASRYQKMPLMVARQNQYPPVVCLSLEGLKALNVKFNCRLTAPKLNLYLILLDDFLKHAVKP